MASPRAGARSKVRALRAEPWRRVAAFAAALRVFGRPLRLARAAADVKEKIEGKGAPALATASLGPGSFLKLSLPWVSAAKTQKRRRRAVAQLGATESFWQKMLLMVVERGRSRSRERVSQRLPSGSLLASSGRAGPFCKAGLRGRTPAQVPRRGHQTKSFTRLKYCRVCCFMRPRVALPPKVGTTVNLPKFSW